VEGELSAAPRHPQYENEGSPPAMNRHLLIVAGGFYVAASAIALPALPGFLYFGLGAVRLRMLTPAPSTAASTSPDAMIGLIEMFARILGSLFRFAGAAGQWMMTALAALFFLALLVAGTLFFTGRGLQVHAGWARVLATLLLSGIYWFRWAECSPSAAACSRVGAHGGGVHLRHLGHAAPIHLTYSVNSEEDCRTSSSTLIEAIAALPISNVADAPLESRESERSA
jgi:hypothetical protein